MGGRRPTLPHAEVAALIQGHRVRDEFSLNALQQDEPVYQTLFELIKLCRKQPPRMRPEPAHDNIPQTFFGIEQLLLRIYAGNATGEEATQMLNGLQRSPIFYRRLLTKLEALAPAATWEETEALGGVKMKSDEEVLALVREISQPVVSQPSFGAWLWQAAVVFFAGVFQAAAQALDFLTGHRAIAVGVPLVLIAAFTFFQIGIGKKDETGGAPYPFASHLRGAEVLEPNDEQFNSFSLAYSNAMTDYVLEDYAAALKTLKSLEPQSKFLVTKLENKKYAALLRDYYFFTGVSHYALSQRKSLFSNDDERHAVFAVKWLTRADSLAQARHLPDRERETSFLKKLQTPGTNSNLP